MEDIIQEKISADHLLYVSLKYTKTCDVIMNLILRWKRMIETSFEKILEHAKKKKKISSIPTNPVGQIKEVRKLLKKDKGGKSIIKVNSSICSGCQLDLPSDIIYQLKKGQIIITCPNCNRILVWKE